MVMVSLRICCLAVTIWCSHGYVNVALNKSTWQSNQEKPGNSATDSSNAVDGLKSDLSARGGQCVASAAGYRTATWWVNLSTVYSIHDIKIYYRTENNVWDASNSYTRRFLGFYLYVSNTTDRLDGHLCFHDSNYSRFTIPAVVNIPCTVHGQYVIYYNERLSNVTYPDKYSRYAHNELCEVEVYGCRAGYFGSNCSLPCPNSCYCHIETGKCSGCKPGYQGYQCEFECDRSKYGKDCRESCGACLGYKQCHHINGSCHEGCDAGYEGNLCEKECLAGKFGNNCESDCNDKCGAPNRCNRTTGACAGGCQTGWTGPHCSKVYTEEKSDRQFIHGTLGAFVVSVTANAVLITYICLRWRKKDTNLPQPMKEISDPVRSKADDIYENADGNVTVEYQELGEMGEPSHYDALQQTKDGIPDSGDEN